MYISCPVWHVLFPAALMKHASFDQSTRRLKRPFETSQFPPCPVFMDTFWLTWNNWQKASLYWLQALWTGASCASCCQSHIHFDDWLLSSNSSAQNHKLKPEPPEYQILMDVCFAILFSFFLTNKHLLQFPGLCAYCPTSHEATKCHHGWEELCNVPIMPPSCSCICLAASAFLTYSLIHKSMLFAWQFSLPSLRSIHSLSHPVRCNG